MWTLKDSVDPVGGFGRETGGGLKLFSAKDVD